MQIIYIRFAQSLDHHSVVYVSRYGTSDDQEGCLELLTIADDGTTSTQKLFCDSDNKRSAKLNSWAPRGGAGHRIPAALAPEPRCGTGGCSAGAR